MVSLLLCESDESSATSLSRDLLGGKEEVKDDDDTVTERLEETVEWD